MNETRPETSEQRMVNQTALMALHRHWQDVSSNRKCSSPSAEQQTDRAQGPVLVIREK